MYKKETRCERGLRCYVYFGQEVFFFYDYAKKENNI